jgi:hypothetical protein
MYFNLFSICEGFKYHRMYSAVALCGSEQNSDLLVYVMNLAEYWKLKEEALNRTVWRTRFRRRYEPVIRETTD